MRDRRYTEEFKIEAVLQITVRGHAAAEVAARLGVSTFSLYQWTKRYSVPEADRVAKAFVIAARAPRSIVWVRVCL